MDEIVLAEILGAEIVDGLQIELPVSGAVTIPVLRRIESRSPATIARVPDCWAPNKPALSFEGRTTFAEFILVHLLDAAGWEARWVKNWAGGRQLCVEVGEQRRLTGRGQEVFDAIHLRAPELRGAGTWDVIAWNGDDLLFLESKQARSGDHLREGQLHFLDTAIQLGVPAEAFAVVEYDAGPALGRGAGQRTSAAARTPREVRDSAAPPAQDPELAKLIEEAASADASERIAYRDGIAAYGAVAIGAMEAWVAEGRGPGLAIAVLEAIGKSSDDAKAAVAALKRLSGTLSDWTAIIEAAIGRLAAAHRAEQASTRRGKPS